MTTIKLGYEVMMNDLKNRLCKKKASFEQHAIRCKQRADLGELHIKDFYLSLTNNFTSISKKIDDILKHLNEDNLDDALSVAKSQESAYRKSLNVLKDVLENLKLDRKKDNYSQDELHKIGLLLNELRYLSEVKEMHSIVDGWVSTLKEYKKFFCD